MHLEEVGISFRAVYHIKIIEPYQYHNADTFISIEMTDK